ncbi:MAG: TetR family transcriptional regulator, partial [Planctomycetaceae bacterium]|nr:TetR family transcriptional regulator [Planctomycetaceae bacterium]
MQPELLSHKLLNTALRLFRELGFSQVEFSQIAESAECSLDELYARFPRKEA